MLPPQHRLRRSQEFSDAVRRGARGSSRSLVVHLVTGAPMGHRMPRTGLVVSKAVGGAVQRNQVKRRLRGLLAERIGTFADAESVVVRAMPAARGASSAELARDLDRALDGARRRGLRASGQGRR